METTVIDLAEWGVRSSVVRIPPVMHSTTDNSGFVPLLVGLAKEKGVIGYPGDGTNRWPAVHVRDLASLFRLLANLVTLDLPASNAITHRELGWKPTQPGLLEELDNGHYFPGA